MNYDAWKTTDPADADPDREDRCRVCGRVDCDPDCSSERDRDEDDGRTYADPRDALEDRR
jgi:hypothetical protein